MTATSYFLALSGSALVLLSASCPDTVRCEVQVVSDGAVIETDTATGSTTATGCEAAVLVDSVGSDTTPSGAVRTLYTIDSVGTDPTPTSSPIRR